jgi:predicted deacetylase
MNEERARHQAVVTKKRAKQRLLGDEAVETKHKDVSNFFSVHLRKESKATPQGKADIC